MRGVSGAIAVATTVTVTVTVAVASGCVNDERGSRTADQAAAAQFVERLQRSFTANDRRALCRGMSAVARRQAGLMAHGTPGQCPADLAEAFRVIDAGGGFKGTNTPEVLGSTAEANGATVDPAGDGRRHVKVPLVRDHGAWRLATFFGTPPRRALAYARAGRAAAVSGAGKAVRVSERGWRCLPIFDADYPRVDGGCELRASGNRVRLTIGTVFGRFEFGECDLRYRVLVDEHGRSWTDLVALTGPRQINNGCSDVRACEDDAGDPLPWKGQISATGANRLVHRMNICLDTCVGYYTGPLTLDLSSGDGDRRAHANKAAIGTSGLELDGSVDLDGDGTEIALPPRP